MQITSDVDLSEYSTMRLGGKASKFCVVKSREDIISAYRWVNGNDSKSMTIGGGSNTIFTDEGFKGLVLKNELKGFDILEESTEQTTIKVASGEVWDQLVNKVVVMGLSGIEALSLIPGTVGAAPVQNIGAYGQELEDVFIELEAYDSESDKFVVLDKEGCEFGYRQSRFKHRDHGRFFITSITIRLSKVSMSPPFYRSLENYFHENSISDYSPAAVREAVINIRQSKLPDPKKIANTGSFFKNPVVSEEKFNEMKLKFADMPGYQSEKGVKLSAGWLLEQAGYKGYRHENGMGTYDEHALVLVNYNARNYAELEGFYSEIIDKIYNMFDITLEIEPEIINGST